MGTSLPVIMNKGYCVVLRNQCGFFSHALLLKLWGLPSGLTFSLVTRPGHWDLLSGMVITLMLDKNDKNKKLVEKNVLYCIKYYSVQNQKPTTIKFTKLNALNIKQIIF